MLNTMIMKIMEIKLLKLLASSILILSLLTNSAFGEINVHGKGLQNSLNELVFIKLSFVCIAANCITCMKSNSFTPEVSVS